MGSNEVQNQEEEKPRVLALAGKRFAQAGKEEPITSKLKDFFDMLFYGPLSILSHIWIQVIILIVMFGFGTIIFMYYQHLPPLTAFLGSVSTITTIGLYAPNIITMTPSEQILLVITFIVSVGLAASIIQSTITSVIRRDALLGRRVARKIGRLEGHVIVAGYSYLGKYVTEWLSRLKVEHVVLTRDASLVRSLHDSGVLAVYSPTTRAFEGLKEVHVERASTLVCAFDDDGDNMLVAMNARRMNPTIRVLASVQDGSLVGPALDSGIDIVLPIYVLTGRILALAAETSEVAGVFFNELKQSGLTEAQPTFPHILEYTVPKGTMELTFGTLNSEAPVLLVIRNGRVISNPPDDFALAASDHVFVLAHKGAGAVNLAAHLQQVQ